MVEENKQGIDNNSELKLSNGSPIQTDWSMFKKENPLGEGSFGTVFKVKCLKNSVV